MREYRDKWVAHLDSELGGTTRILTCPRKPSGSTMPTSSTTRLDLMTRQVRSGWASRQTSSLNTKQPRTTPRRLSALHEGEYPQRPGRDRWLVEFRYKPTSNAPGSISLIASHGRPKTHVSAT
jgi:hypothetical protein